MAWCIRVMSTSSVVSSRSEIFAGVAPSFAAPFSKRNYLEGSTSMVPREIMFSFSFFFFFFQFVVFL